ncbi:MAG: hypothetical protein IRZ33_08015 [Alicyclobacillaceae bacterium]|nr:hypothetical protein [Alicyclobacillaceae bacterium]
MAKVVVFACAAAASTALAAPPPRALAGAGVEVTREQVMLVPAPVVRKVEVLQVLTVSNRGPAASDLTVSVPAGASAVRAAVSRAGTGGNVAAPARSVSVAHGRIRLTNAVQAGASATVTVTYTVPFTSSDGAGIVLHLDYPVDMAYLYIPVGRFALSAPGLQLTTQTVTLSGLRFRVFSRPAVPAGSDWPVDVEVLPDAGPGATGADVKGLPVIGTDDTGRANSAQALGNLALAAFIFALGLVGVRRASRPTAGRPATTAEALYRSWEQVERLRAAGVLDETDYQRRREQLKQRLVAMRLAETREDA